MINRKNLSVNEGTSDDEEGLLSDWTIVVFTLTTTALLFYHMTAMKTVHIHRKAAAGFASGLILIALLYNILSMTAFIQRTESIINTLDKNTKESKPVRIAVRKSQISYGTLTFFVSIIQLGLVIAVIQTSFPELGINIPYLTPENPGIYRRKSRRKY